MAEDWILLDAPSGREPEVDAIRVFRSKLIDLEERGGHSVWREGINARLYKESLNWGIQIHVANW